jgi:hypothetical protein
MTQRKNKSDWRDGDILTGRVEQESDPKFKIAKGDM